MRTTEDRPFASQLSPEWRRTFAQRLLLLAEKLDWVEHNDLQHWGYQFICSGLPFNRSSEYVATSIHCATSACAIGWATELRFAQEMGFKPRISPGSSMVLVLLDSTASSGDMFIDTSKVFGIPVRHWNWLFQPEHGEEAAFGIVDLPADAMPSQVADNIRRYVAGYFGYVGDSEHMTCVRQQSTDPLFSLVT